MTKTKAIKEFFAKNLIDQKKTIDQVIDEVNKKYNLTPDELIEIGKTKTNKRVKNLYLKLAMLKQQDGADNLSNEILNGIWETKYYLASLEWEN